MDMKTKNWSGTAMRPVGLIIRQKDPNNLEMPFDQLDEFITPSELFYIRSHFPTPKLDPLAYRLSIQRRRAERAKPELRRYPRHAFTDMRRHTGMRRQQPGIHGAAGAGRAMGARCGRQCRMDRCSPFRAAGARRTSRRSLRIGTRRRRSRRAEGRAKAPGSDLLCPQYPADAGDGARRADRLPDERARI